MRLLIAFLLSLSVLVQSPAVIVVHGPRVAAAGGTCTDLVAFLAFGANNGAITTAGQKIRNDSGMTVCSVKLALSGSGNAEVVLNSASDGSGTDYGSASGVQALGGSFAEVTFTWTSNPTVSAGTHYYIVARGNGGGSISGYQVSTGDVYEAGNSYDGYQNGSVITTTDLRFELRTIQ
jgi:hypothetical protein